MEGGASAGRRRRSRELTALDSATAADELRALKARFPASFVWGAATAAYQVEGAVDADGRAPSIWDTFSREPGRTHNGDTGDIACDHYRRWSSDLDLMADLGLRAYRFSVAWPRVQPGGSGPANPRGLDFYDRLVDGLLERGIEPWVTLYHWDLPQELEDRGGWMAPDVVERFADYAALVARRIGDRAAAWITLNEPRTFGLMGYGTGEHAPGRRGWAEALRAVHHAHLAHAAATSVIRSEVAGARIGISHDVAHLAPGSAEAEDLEALVRYDGAMHRWFLDPTFGRGYPADMVAWYGNLGMLDGIDPDAVAGQRPPDVLGLNYYRLERVVAAPPDAEWGIGARLIDPVGLSTGLGWEIHPDGLRATLERITREYAPAAIAVTENGGSFGPEGAVDGVVRDEERTAYLESHLAAAADAIQAGVPLVGYFAWSLLDNFEWSMGYDTRFGLVHVDFATQRRTIKSSGRWYRSLLAAGRERAGELARLPNPPLGG